MLQQILRDMYVDPDILAELDEQQKQTLFCKMREEQVRRWTSWNEKLEETPPTKPSRSNTIKYKKTVNFLLGIDGEPWVWVMGEHENDKSIEDILKGESLEKARQMAEKETEELRKQVEAQLSEYIELQSPKIEDLETLPPFPVTDFQVFPQKSPPIIEDDMDIYCSVDELREKINAQKNTTNSKLSNYSLNHYQNANINNKNSKFNFMETREVLQEISLNTQKVAQKVALWEKRLTEERTCEILKNMQRKRQEVAREAEEEDKKKEQMWREQERKAKEAEQQIREIARRARAEHRLTSTMEIDTAYSTVNSGVPPGRKAVLEWYRNYEKARSAGLDGSNNVEPWFHGLITRSEAEKLLLDQPYGTFLVRLSEKIWGYAISYRAKEKCKHYLVQAAQKYSFSGSNQIEHNTLGDLIKYHHAQPLTGGEKLMYPCPRTSMTAIDEMFGDNH